MASERVDMGGYTLTENAAFLKSHTAELEKLAALREGRPIVTTTAP